MKAVEYDRFGGPEVLEVKERPIPEAKAGQVLIQMAYAGLGRPDHLMRSGEYPWTADCLPMCPGPYGTGWVAALGEGVSGLRIGNPVYVEHPTVCSCCAEYKVAPAELVAPLPVGINMEQAALMSAYIVAWGMLTECFGYSSEKTLYISGAAGAIGTAVIQLASVLGMRVIASASSEEKCAYLRSLNADCVFQYNRESPKDRILAFTNGRGADIIMDQRVGPAFCEQLDYLADMGTILIYNNTQGGVGHDTVSELVRRFARCQSIRVFSFHYFDTRPELLAQKRSEVFEKLVQGKIAPQIAARFSMDDVRQAHELLDSGNFCGGITIGIRPKGQGTR